MSGPAIAWVEAVNAIGRFVQTKPLPNEMIVIETDDWKLTLNNTDSAQSIGDNELGRFEVLAEGKEYFVFAIVAPSGGMIGGMSEDDFTEEMKRIASVAKEAA